MTHAAPCGIRLDIGLLRRARFMTRWNRPHPGWGRLTTSQRVEVLAAHEWSERAIRVLVNEDLEVAHALAVRHAPFTPLRISEQARRYLWMLRDLGAY